MSLYQACQPFMAAVKAAQPVTSEPVWTFEFRGWPWSATWRAFPAAQLAVLRTFLAEAPACYLQMNPSDVLEWAPSKSWDRPYKETFQLPAGIDPAALTKEVLYLGGYLLYCAPAPIEPSLLQFDPWRKPPAELVEVLRGLGATGFIAAHFDNDAWRLSFPFAR